MNTCTHTSPLELPKITEIIFLILFYLTNTLNKGGEDQDVYCSQPPGGDQDYLAIVFSCHTSLYTVYAFDSCY